MSQLFTGKIHFACIPSYDEMTDISYFLLEKAIINRIGLNLNYVLTVHALHKYPLRDYLKDGYIPFEIVDAPWVAECRKIIEGVWYADKTFRIACVDQSRLPSIQNFFEEIIGHEMISHIMFELEDLHNMPADFYEFEIKANQFCQIIINTPNHNNSMPILRLKIIK
ncbi:hypothetical protein [Paenibacillus spongiae]|uniref:Uncharacterized protein n=1 Tax=Paenibacillus spongiae TaxID=2909671 RepID=A0ABY5S6M1_9BACL|nr:hypothetical protein [Paenibacillus spongiae]UVI28497.1 hypothetical protein L1F29_24025 [Paenibacillus spongiae]